MIKNVAIVILIILQVTTLAYFLLPETSQEQKEVQLRNALITYKRAKKFAPEKADVALVNLFSLANEYNASAWANTASADTVGCIGAILNFEATLGYHRARLAQCTFDQPIDIYCTNPYEGLDSAAELLDEECLS